MFRVYTNVARPIVVFVSDDVKCVRVCLKVDTPWMYE